MRVQTVDIRSAGSSRKGSMAASIAVGFDERLVALDVDDEVAIEAGCNFGEPIGAREMIGSRHPHGSAELRNRVGDSRIVGRDNHGINIAGGQLRGAYTCSIIGRPAISASAFPGKRVDA